MNAAGMSWNMLDYRVVIVYPVLLSGLLLLLVGCEWVTKVH